MSNIKVLNLLFEPELPISIALAGWETALVEAVTVRNVVSLSSLSSETEDEASFVVTAPFRALVPVASKPSDSGLIVESEA